MGELSLEHETKKIRIAPESFSDIIFGLALSIGSLILIQNRITGWQSFVGSIVIFGFSFLIIALIWLLFSRTVSYLSIEGSPIVYLNLVLFFCVALEPYLFYLLMNQDYQLFLNFTSMGYALDVGIMFIVLSVLTSIILKQDAMGRANKKPIMNLTQAVKFKHMRIAEFIAGACFIISAAPFFWFSSPIGTIRFVFWYATFAVWLVVHNLSVLRLKKI